MTLNEKMIGAIEERLNLRGGSTLVELSADVVLRCALDGIKSVQLQKQGKAAKLLEAVLKTEKRTPTAVEEIEKKKREYERLIKEANTEFKAARAAKNREFDKPILDYIVSKYGPPRKDKFQEVCGFGTLAFKDGHFMRKFNTGVPDPLDDLLRDAEEEEKNGKGKK